MNAKLRAFVGRTISALIVVSFVLAVTPASTWAQGGSVSCSDIGQRDGNLICSKMCVSQLGGAVGPGVWVVAGTCTPGTPTQSNVAIPWVSPVTAVGETAVSTAFGFVTAAAATAINTYTSNTGWIGWAKCINEQSRAFWRSDAQIRGMCAFYLDSGGSGGNSGSGSGSGGSGGTSSGSPGWKPGDPKPPRGTNEYVQYKAFYGGVDVDDAVAEAWQLMNNLPPAGQMAYLTNSSGGNLRIGISILTNKIVVTAGGSGYNNAISEIARILGVVANLR